MIVYVVKNFFLSILFFFKHWYVGSFQWILGKTRGIIRGLEMRLALRINIYFMFAPLWQERNVYGYALGFLFRSVRIVAGVVAYCLIVATAIAAYLLWALIPVGIIYQIIFGGGKII